MKIKILFLFALWFTFSTAQAQVKDAPKEKFKPYFITFTHLHGYDSVNKENWRLIEEEFFKKVTSKNKYIVHYQFLVNYAERDKKDYIIMKVFKDWNDIHLAEKETSRLIEKAWPDEEKRTAFFEKMNENYELYYSNTIYRSARLANFKSKASEIVGKPLLFYVIHSKLRDYQGEDSVEAYERYTRNVTHKNPYIRAYLAQKQYYGPDSRDFVEIFAVDDYPHLIKAFEKDKELLKAMIPDENEREKFIEVYNKGIRRATSELYINVPSISK